MGQPDERLSSLARGEGRLFALRMGTSCVQQLLGSLGMLHLLL